MAASKIRKRTKCFPYCVVWAPLPVWGWFYPFLGHAALGLSDGRLMDFSTSYVVLVDTFAFGRPLRYWMLHPAQCADSLEAHAQAPGNFWDEGVRRGVQEFQHEAYSILRNNCHSFVARCLNELGAQGRRDWTVPRVFLAQARQGRYTGLAAAFGHLGPFAVVMGAGLGGGWRAHFLLVWLVGLVLVAGWFHFFSGRAPTRRKVTPPDMEPLMAV